MNKEILRAAGFDVESLTAEQVEIFTARIINWRQRARVYPNIDLEYALRRMSDQERAGLRLLVEENAYGYAY